jgi:hypothetical protein
VATVAVTKDVSGVAIGDSDVVDAAWLLLTTTDNVGAAFPCAAFSDRTIQVYGSFFGATITIQGSLDGTNWFTLNDQSDNALTVTTAGGDSVQQLTRFIRPSLSGGDSGGTTSLNVRLCAKRG